MKPNPKLANAIEEFDGLNLSELLKLSTALLNEISKREEQDKAKNPKEYETAKALEIKMINLTGGAKQVVTLAQFSEKLLGLVSDCIEGQGGKNALIKTIPGRYSYYSGVGYQRRGGKTAAEQAREAEKMFEQYSGEFAISGTGSLKIYALKKKTNPEELQLRKNKREIAKLEKEIVTRRKEQQQAAKDAKNLKSKLSQAKAEELKLQKKLKTLKK